MAAYAYLVDPEKQFMTKSGTINVAGFLRVYDASTDDRVITYQDFQGTENEFEIKLDNNGRAIVIADSARVYRLEVYDRYGSLQWTTSPLWCLAAGGGAAIHRTDVVSTDGSLAVDKVEVGSTTTFDLSTHVQDGDDLIEAIRCDGAEVLQGTDIYRPIYTAGTMEVGDKGLILLAGRYYHVTAHVKATKSVQRDPFYDEVNIRFVIDDGETQTDSVVSKRIVDYSLGLSQEFEVSTDVIPETDCELLLVIDGHDVQNGSFELLDLEAHRVYSGAPYIPSGVLSRAQAADIYQEKLIAGDNITIEGNVISATGDFEQVQSDWTETDTTADSFIRHKPQTKPVVAGQNIVIDETSTQFVISATAEPQEQANWNESDSSSVQYIQNKPDLSVYATTQAMNTALAGKQDTLTAGTNVQIANNVISATDTTYTAGTGIDITADVISVETPVDIVAGPGIVIDNPDGNTLRVSLGISGSWTDVSTEASYSTTNINAGSFKIMYNPALNLVALTCDVNVGAGETTFFTWSNRLKPVFNDMALGSNLYVGQSGLKQSAGSTSRWINGAFMWPVVGGN